VDSFPKTKGEGEFAEDSTAVAVFFFSDSPSVFFLLTTWMSLFPETLVWLPGTGRSGKGGRTAEDWFSIFISSGSKALAAIEVSDKASASGAILEIMVTIPQSWMMVHDITFYKS
jgi:hypothetical protein